MLGAGQAFFIQRIVTSRASLGLQSTLTAFALTNFLLQRKDTRLTRVLGVFLLVFLSSN
jgi:hypothetical protein